MWLPNECGLRKHLGMNNVLLFLPIQNEDPVQWNTQFSEKLQMARSLIYRIYSPGLLRFLRVEVPSCQNRSTCVASKILPQGWVSNWSISQLLWQLDTETKCSLEGWTTKVASAPVGHFLKGEGHVLPGLFPLVLPHIGSVAGVRGGWLLLLTVAEPWN